MSRSEKKYIKQSLYEQLNNIPVYMKIYTPEVIEISDTEKIRADAYQLKRDHLIRVLLHFGYDQASIGSLLDDTSVLLINELTSYKLYRHFNESNGSDLQSTLDNVSIEVCDVDSYKFICLRLPETPPISEDLLSKIRAAIDSKLRQGNTRQLTITGPERKTIQLSLANPIFANQLDSFFENYIRWIDEQIIWINPYFDTISHSIQDYLSNKLGGLKANKHNFVDWFINEKLANLEINFELVFDKNSGHMIDGYKTPVTLKVISKRDNSDRRITYEDFIEYLLWERDMVDQSFNRVFAKKALANQAHPKQIEENTYTSFEDLFFDKGQIERCINALRDFDRDKPVLGSDRNWLGSRKKKGIIVAWVERLESMKPAKIRRISDRRNLVELLNRFFEGLDMGEDARVFRAIVPHDLKHTFAALLPD